MSRTGSKDHGDELLNRLGTLTAQARAAAEVQRSRVELAVALQRGMLPRDLPAGDGVRLAVRYVPANQGLNVGGDWYDAFTMPDGRIGLSIGDVQGHNIEAAAFMGQVRVGLRALASVGGDPGELLARTNELLLTLGGDLFATCTFMRLDPETRLLESARAGHLPCVWATADGRSGVTEDEGGPPLGVQSGAVYPVTRYRLDSGGVFVMVTDGVVEGPSMRLDEGLEQVSRLAGIAAVARMDVDALAAAVIRGAAEVGHDDDAAVLVIGHDKPAGQP
ncbi:MULTISPECIES: SpoIIE family protein phosphatase [Streptomyces]|jgi:serine phosphatase RsbU (regulator of sigma subunit)|uniref:PP2C family protein-serine/threonine phosphatase n=1 Tax=Streptomyces thermocarboxydus TaxID=59299 RepID=A0ABU3JCT0_9ACTN|nr:serine/threonine-protein phosphatase [Streptomyces sp. McG8]MDT6972855.1 PP2C family protein-serine/threonine phosphatase [Streptomyces thermocarboxydus]MDX3414568.1 PP2C family protein-serine/threonine phosphatase [Streptomyces sp. MD20-1-1]MXQ58123.1 SpoIIE family protein phosphatase [Streptomyces sp. XHT-2]MYQ36301.1 SpoIIE family protein phosphatase [Streptomyces sp. SID4956]MYW52433.1 SpoIIE family protein phosphatase [Streptomyces sp. SID8376]WSB82604.1 serine/threonine-protein phosp